MKLYIVEGYCDYGWEKRLVVAPTRDMAQSDVEALGMTDVVAYEVSPLRGRVYPMPNTVFRTVEHRLGFEDK